MLAFLKRPSPFCRHLRRAIPRNSRLALCENVQTVLFVVKFVSFLWFMTTTIFFFAEKISRYMWLICLYSSSGPKTLGGRLDHHMSQLIGSILSLEAITTHTMFYFMFHFLYLG